ncbi:MAG: hypothetical protein HGA85_05530 [Nanoarchaeota archaeon]|nr:hypothetical protein [Nanoarchaeota archaeon]
MQNILFFEDNVQKELVRPFSYFFGWYVQNMWALNIKSLFFEFIPCAFGSWCTPNTNSTSDCDIQIAITPLLMYALKKTRGEIREEIPPILKSRWNMKEEDSLFRLLEKNIAILEKSAEQQLGRDVTIFISTFDVGPPLALETKFNKKLLDGFKGNLKTWTFLVITNPLRSQILLTSAEHRSVIQSMIVRQNIPIADALGLFAYSTRKLLEINKSISGGTVKPAKIVKPFLRAIECFLCLTSYNDPKSRYFGILQENFELLLELIETDASWLEGFAEYVLINLSLTESQAEEKAARKKLILLEFAELIKKSVLIKYGEKKDLQKIDLALIGLFLEYLHQELKLKLPAFGISLSSQIALIGYNLEFRKYVSEADAWLNKSLGPLFSHTSSLNLVSLHLRDFDICDRIGGFWLEKNKPGFDKKSITHLLAVVMNEAKYLRFEQAKRDELFADLDKMYKVSLTFNNPKFTGINIEKLPVIYPKLATLNRDLSRSLGEFISALESQQILLERLIYLCDNLPAEYTEEKREDEKKRIQKGISLLFIGESGKNNRLADTVVKMHRLILTQTKT